MGIYFTYTLAGNISATSFQWVSGSFYTSLVNVDKITPMELIISAVVPFALPTVSHRWLRPRLRSKQNTDFAIITAGLIFCVFGAAIMAVAMSISLSIYALGVAVSALSVGLADSLRSFATSAFIRHREPDK
jgi:small-conductance mechanosensitive channel